MTRPRNRWWTCLLILALAGAIPAAAEPAESAETIEERLAVGLVERFSEGDVDAITAYMESNFAPALLERQSLDGWRRMATMIAGRHQGMEITGIEISMPHQIRILADSPAGLVLEFGLDFEPAPPHRIAGFSIEAGGHAGGDRPELPPFEVGPGTGEAGIAAALEAWFAGLAESDAFSGSVLVAIDGRLIFQTALGLASRRWGVANTTATRFDLGSINKSFTKVAVAQLWQQGKLSLDDTVAELLPDYPNRETAAKITVQHLLEHSSGLGDIFTDEYRELSKALFRRPEDFFRLFADRPLRFEPGERSEYSNAGFMVLGAIVTALSGQPYDEYVVEHIFAPAGMESTIFFSKDEPTPDVAVGYTVGHGPRGDDGKVRNNNFLLPIRGNSAGSAYATAEDLLRFDNALREHRLLPPAYSAWVLGGPEPAPGVEASDERLGIGIGIAGGAPGVSAVMESDGRLTLVILSNQDEPGAELLSRHLRRPLTRAVAN